MLHRKNAACSRSVAFTLAAAWCRFRCRVLSLCFNRYGNGIIRYSGVFAADVDSKIRFSIEPLPGDDAFDQWRDGMKAVAGLPMGIPADFRKKVSSVSGSGGDGFNSRPPHHHVTSLLKPLIHRLQIGSETWRLFGGFLVFAGFPLVLESPFPFLRP